MTTIEIEYCVPCGLRESTLDALDAILEAFDREVDGLTLTPSYGDVFKVYVDGEVVFDKDEQDYDIDTITDAIQARRRMSA